MVISEEDQKKIDNNEIQKFTEGFSYSIGVVKVDEWEIIPINGEPIKDIQTFFRYYNNTMGTKKELNGYTYYFGRNDYVPKTEMIFDKIRNNICERRYRIRRDKFSNRVIHDRFLIVLLGIVGHSIDGEENFLTIRYYFNKSTFVIHLWTIEDKNSQKLINNITNILQGETDGFIKNSNFNISDKIISCND